MERVNREVMPALDLLLQDPQPTATDQKHKKELILHFEQNGDFIINAD